MATIVTKTVGTAGGRDYSTLQAAIDDCPANLVTADQVYRLELYNDSEFTAGVTFPAITTDSTRYVEVTAAAGQSFMDHASVRSNALTYDQSKGVGINVTGGFVNAIELGTAYTRISRIQIKTTSGTPIDGTTAANMLVKDVILSYSGHGYGGARAFGIDSGTFINVLAILRSSAPANGLHVYNNGTFIGCTVVRLSDFTAGNTALSTSYGTNVVESCALFGFTTATSGGSWSGGNNASNVASGLPGSDNQHSVTFSASTPFEEGSSTGTDLRAIASTALDGNGSLDSTNAPNDISGTARPATPTIGVWELNAGGGGGGVNIPAAFFYGQQFNASR